MTNISNWTEICDLEEVPVRGSRKLNVADMKIALFRTIQNEVYAIEDKCPHLGGELSEGIVHGAKVTCPLHNLVLDLKSGKAVAPDAGCVKRFPVKLKNKKIIIDLTSLASEAV